MVTTTFLLNRNARNETTSDRSSATRRPPWRSQVRSPRGPCQPSQPGYQFVGRRSILSIGDLVRADRQAGPQLSHCGPAAPARIINTRSRPSRSASGWHQLPQWMLSDLDVVQLSSMTRKKETAPCYGMQWGTALYLYPIETKLVEEYSESPKPILYNEARMYGGRWKQFDGAWQLIWTEEGRREISTSTMS